MVYLHFRNPNRFPPLTHWEKVHAHGTVHYMKLIGPNNYDMSWNDFKTEACQLWKKLSKEKSNFV